MAENKNKKSLDEMLKDLKIPISESLLNYLKKEHPIELEIFVKLLSQCTPRNIDLFVRDTPEEWFEKFSNNTNLQADFLKKKKYLKAEEYEKLDKLSEAITKRYPHVPDIIKGIKAKKEEKVEEKKEVKIEKKEDITKIENIIKKNLKKYSETRDPEILKELQKFQEDIKEIVPKLKNNEDIKRLQFLSQEIKNAIKIIKIEDIIKKNLKKYSETKDPEILKELQKFQEDIKEIVPKLKNNEDIQHLQSLSQKIGSVIKINITAEVNTKISAEKPEKKKEILNVTQVSKIPGIIIEQNKDGSLNNISFNIEEINKLSPENKEKALKLSLKDVSNTTDKNINIDTPIFIKTDNNEIKLNPDFQNEMVKLNEYEVTAHDNKISLVPYTPTNIQVSKTEETAPKEETKETPPITQGKEATKKAPSIPKKGKKTVGLKVKKEIKIPMKKKPKEGEIAEKPSEELTKTKQPEIPPVTEMPEIQEPKVEKIEQPSKKVPEVPLTKPLESTVPIAPEIKVPEKKVPTPQGPVEEIKAPQKGIKLAPHIAPYIAPTKKYISEEAGGKEGIVPPPPPETEMPEQYIEEQMKKTQPPAPKRPTEAPTVPEEGEITPEERELEEKKEEEGKKEEKKEEIKETAEEQAKKIGKKEAKKQIKKEIITLLIENPYVLVILFAIIIVFTVIIVAFASTAMEEELRESRAICQNEPDKTSPEKCAEIETEFKQLELGKEGDTCTVNAHCDSGFTCIDNTCKSE